jgi:hypothetical protein
VLRIEASLDDVTAKLGGRDAVEVWVTAAREVGPAISFGEARTRLGEEGKAVLILFGTGWGLAPSVVQGADAVLEPIRPQQGSYNHLSVRAACAIALDRLLGQR